MGRQDGAIGYRLSAIGYRIGSRVGVNHVAEEGFNVVGGCHGVAPFKTAGFLDSEPPTGLAGWA